MIIALHPRTDRLQRMGRSQYPLDAPDHGIGLATALSRSRELVQRRRRNARTAVAALLVIASISLVTTQYEPAPRAPYQGSESATRFVDQHAEPDDLIIITAGATFSYANSTTRPLTLVDTP